MKRVSVHYGVPVISSMMERKAVFGMHYRAACDCIATCGQVSAEDCDRVAIFDQEGKEVAVFVGQRYRVIERRDKTIAVFSLPANVRMEASDMHVEEQRCR
jgi:hypothetical protein